MAGPAPDARAVAYHVFRTAGYLSTLCGDERLAMLRYFLKMVEMEAALESGRSADSDAEPEQDAEDCALQAPAERRFG